jgi:hypothetical protein
VKTLFARVPGLFLLCLSVLLTPAASTQVIEVTGDVAKIPVSPNREDVKAVGMGRTQIANGYHLNGMLYNPAVLARSKTRIDILTLSGELPKDTPDALALLRDEYEQFTTGQFLKDINAGAKELQDYFKGVPGADQTHALSLLNRGLGFTRQLQEKVLGTPEVPMVHGAAVIPAIQLQIGNFGFALYGNVQAGFQAAPTATTNRLYSLHLPSKLEDLTADEIDNLLEIVGGLFDAGGNLSLDGAIPVTYALGFFDVVGAAGYGRQITPELSVGGTFKVINRRFSNKIIDASNYGDIMGELRSEFNASVTGVSFDLGAMYHVPKTGLDLGLSLQNVIPMKSLESTVTVRAVVYDSLGNPYNIRVRAPFELTLPFLANLGANYRITKSWDASLDWVDIASQDDKYENYFDRVRIGTEYRLDAVRDKLGIAFRGGLAAARPTAGLGVNIYNIVQLDAAYAYDPFFNEYAWYGQLRFGW